MGGTDHLPAVVTIMAKAPRAGVGKTRLCPPLSPDEAAGLYRCFLLDTIDRIRALEGASVAIAHAAATDRAFFEDACPELVLVAQHGPDLGTRLANVFDQLFGRGFRAVLAMGADTPTLPGEFLRRALDALADPRLDLALGPTEDGGYYLIGLRAPRPELFEGIPWSTSRVFDETMRRARAVTLNVAVLPRWYDVDTIDDLRRLRASLAGPAGADAPRTRDFLVALMDGAVWTA